MAKVEELARQTREKIIRYAKTTLKQPLVEDLGDYIPFLAYFGERELCDENISRCSEEIFSSSLPTQREDTLLGLIEFYRFTEDEAAMNLARRYVGYLFSNYYYGEGICVPVEKYIEHVFDTDKVKSTRNKVTRICLEFIHRILRTRVSIPRNGIFVELLTDMYDLTGEQKYLNMAENLISPWLQNKTFEKFGLFPSFRLNPFADKYATLSKDNTAVVNGLIALYEKTHKDIYEDGILKWCEAVRSRCFDESVYGIYYFSDGKKEKQELMYAFAVIDVLCDAFLVLRQETLLDFGEKIAKFWIDLQSRIGLFPMTKTSLISHQDYTNDFSISLWRLYELTNDEYYREVSEKAMVGLFKYHTFDLKVNCQSGRVIDGSVIPKYVFLMLKPVILLQEKAIYKNKKITKLLRDR